MTGNLGVGQINAGGGARNGTHIKRNLIPLQNKYFILAVQNFILTIEAARFIIKVSRGVYIMKKTLTAELFLTSLNNDSELIHFFIKKLKSTGIQVTSYPSGNNEILFQCQWPIKEIGRPIKHYYTDNKQLVTCGMIADILSSNTSCNNIDFLRSLLIDEHGQSISESTLRRRLSSHLQNNDLYNSNTAVF